jgi:hypothetical protein
MNLTTPTVSPAIISPDQFNQYTENWLTVAGNPDDPALEQSFLNGDTRVAYVSFPIERIVWLLSAVGVRQIKARFLLVPDENDLHFSIALFATDDEGTQLSAYHVADPFWSTAATPPLLGGPIPTSLADIWMANWQNLEQAVTADLFIANQAEGTLQGYNFKVQDFVKLLSGQSFEDQAVRIDLGLHEYYPAQASGDTSTKTFGLMLRLATPGQDSPTYYDMATPCPPGN